MIKIRDLTYSYDNKTKALDKISLDGYKEIFFPKEILDWEECSMAGGSTAV